MDFKVALVCMYVSVMDLSYEKDYTHTHTCTRTHYTLHSRFHILQFGCLLNNFRDYKFQKFYIPIGREVKLQQIFLLEYNVKRKHF